MPLPPDKKTVNSDKMPPPPSRNLPTGRKTTDSEGIRAGKQGLKRLWSNYKKLLRDSFNEMSRDQQEELIDKFSVIITVGTTGVLVLNFYHFVPLLLRVLGVPLSLVIAWWAGRRIVAPVIIDRLTPLLKREEKDDDVNRSDR